MSSITTHVLDIAHGKPAAGISVILHAQTENGWHEVGRGLTNQDGRVANLVPPAGFKAGRYRLTFDTAGYHVKTTTRPFFPEVTITFDVADASQSYHVPLLLSPFGYSTYRGS